jgi:sortase A
MANRPRRAAVVLRTLEVLLLTIGLVSVAWYATAHTSAIREQVALSEELDRLVASRAAASAQPTRPTTTSTTSTTSSTTDAFRLKAEATGVKKGLIGRIEVPRIKMSAVAREGIDVRTLRVAVGHIPGTALPGQPGNAGFAAHRDTFFRPLKSVREGDEIVVTTPGGVYRYAVTGTSIVEPRDVAVLEPTADAILTLVTCYPFEYIGNAPQRFIVRAALRGK